MSRLRPYFDKVGNLKARRLRGFLAELSVGGPLWPALPKVAWCLLRGFNQREFTLYRPHRMSWARLGTYHTTIDNVRLIDRLNPEAQRWLLRDKGAFLRRFSHRLNREFVDLRQASIETFADFLRRHPRCVAKTYNLAMGVGIEVIDPVPDSVAVPSLHERLVGEEKYIVEGYIEQHPDLARVYPESVNSVRLHTLLESGGRARILFPPVIRFGSGGGRIDAEGERTVLLDAATGRSLGDAVARNGEFSAVHPDTRVPFAEVRVPGLAEAADLVRAAALEVPEVRYVGWDIAITPAGPVLIEGNGAPAVSTLQLLLARHLRHGEGCRRDLAAVN